MTFIKDYENKGRRKEMENNIDTHDKKEIEKLKSFKKWYLWFLSSSEEEKKEYLKNRWNKEIQK